MSSTSNPQCNHCGTILDDEQLWYGEYEVGKIDTDDCEMSGIKCPNSDCGKTYYTMCFRNVSFISVDKNGNEL